MREGTNEFEQGRFKQKNINSCNKAFAQVLQVFGGFIENGYNPHIFKGIKPENGYHSLSNQAGFELLWRIRQQGYGYNVELLYREIGNILGVSDRFTTIIIGAGNMGQALANYENFEKRGFTLIGIFDINPQIIGKKIRNVEIKHMNEMDDFCRDNHVDIAILTVPYQNIPEVAKKVASLGIKGLWNFSAMDLKLSYDDIIIENVHLSDSLMVLGYKLNERRKAEETKKAEEARKVGGGKGSRGSQKGRINTKGGKSKKVKAGGKSG